jgi:hypothetical protein
MATNVYSKKPTQKFQPEFVSGGEDNFHSDGIAMSDEDMPSNRWTQTQNHGSMPKLF